jgi:hypothetical protein
VTIVSTKSVSITLELMLVADSDGGVGAGDATSFVGILPGAVASLVGILPARAVTDISPVRATANTTDFMLAVSFLI